MRKLLLRVFSLSVLSAMLLFNACSKDGEVGPQGEQGEQGDKGDKGDKGDQGEKGTANVIYSDWLDVQYGLNEDTTAFVAVLDAPGLVDSILQHGEVKVYLNLNTAADPVIAPLPYVEGSIYISTLFSLEEIFFISNINASTGMQGADKVFQYRYILIPGGAPARNAVDWNDYNAVKKYLGLKD